MKKLAVIGNCRRGRNSIKNSLIIAISILKINFANFEKQQETATSEIILKIQKRLLHEFQFWVNYHRNYH